MTIHVVIQCKTLGILVIPGSLITHTVVQITHRMLSGLLQKTCCNKYIALLGRYITDWTTARFEQLIYHHWGICYQRNVIVLWGALIITSLFLNKEFI